MWGAAKSQWNYILGLIRAKGEGNIVGFLLMFLVSRKLVVRGKFVFRWVNITWYKRFLDILNYLAIAVLYWISTYAHISPSDIEIILIKKGLKINSDAVLKIYILSCLSYFPDVLKDESFQYISSVLLGGFPDLSHLYTDLTDLYLGRTSSRDEQPPSLLSALQLELHPGQGDLYYYWDNKANHDTRTGSSTRMSPTRWWSLCQSVALIIEALGPSLIQHLGLYLLYKDIISYAQTRLKSAPTHDLRHVYPHWVYIWTETG